MKIRNIVAWVVLLAGALVIAYEWAPSHGQQWIQPEKRQAATQFTLVDSNGAKVNLSDYKDKVVLLNLWATWCVPCEVEIPWFIEFEKTYKDRGFAVLGMSVDDDGWDVVKPYIAKSKMNYRIILGTEDMAKGYWDVQAIPTTFLIDRQGRVAVTHTGLVSKQTYEDGILKLLAGT